MKKIISILVILTMLVSACAFAVPASAAVSGDLTLPVSNWNKPWTTDNTWIAVDSYDDLLNAFRNNDATVQKKLYLTKDIDIPATRFLVKNGSTEIPSENFILDGNGYAFKYTDNSAAVFFKMNNAVIRNLKLTGSMIADGDGRSGCPAYSPLGDGWQYNNKVTLENVVSNVNITVKNQDTYTKNASGVIAVVGADSKLTNVKYTGTIACAKVNSSDTITGLAGIAGWVRGVNVIFEKCSTVGATLSVPSTYKGFGYQTKNDRLDVDLGMIFGLAENDVTLKNCTAGGTISFAAKVPERPNGNNGTEKTPLWIGGMGGHSKGKATFTDCTNTVSIVVNNKDNPIEVISAGGFIGNALGGLSMTNCTNNGSVVAQETPVYMGGFVGKLANNTANEFINCTNGRNGTLSRSMANNNAGIAGFIGILHGEGKPNLKVKFEGCVNEADITNIASSLTNPNGGSMMGGFVGEARCVSNLEFKNCINNGDIKTLSTDAVKDYQGSGGFIGCQRIAGFSWTTSVKTITTKFTNCLNTGDITSVHSAGGLVGRSIEMQKPDNTYGAYTMTFENCANTGTINAPQAGGMYGAANDDSGYVCLVDMTFNKCINAGKIENGGKPDSAILGGLIGDTRHGSINVTNSVSAAEIAKGASVAGIIANAGESATVSVKNSYVLGTIDESSKVFNPVCNGKSTFKGNLFDENMIDDWFDEADNVDAKDVEEAIDALDIIAAYGFDRLETLIDESGELSNKQNEYDATKWTAFQTALNKAKTVADSEIMTISKTGVSILAQTTVNKAYNDLYSAKIDLEGKGEEEESGIEALIKQVGKLDSEDYTAASWTNLQSALASAKAAVASGSAEIIADAAELLENAINALVEVEDTPADDNGNNGEENTTPTPDATEPSDDGEDDGEADTDATQKPATDADEESDSGCGGVIGASAVAVVAVMALGMGVTFKKKD